MGDVAPPNIWVITNNNNNNNITSATSSAMPRFLWARNFIKLTRADPVHFLLSELKNSRFLRLVCVSDLLREHFNSACVFLFLLSRLTDRSDDATSRLIISLTFLITFRSNCPFSSLRLCWQRSRWSGRWHGKWRRCINICGGGTMKTTPTAHMHAAFLRRGVKLINHRCWDVAVWSALSGSVALRHLFLSY